jgi:integrase
VPIVSLTDKGVRALDAPDSGQITYWDKSLKSSGLRVSQGGARSWVVMLGKERRRITIGKYPAVSLADARKHARTLIAEQTLGKFRPARTSFDAALKEFLAVCQAKNKPRTAKDYERLLTKHLKFGPRALIDITARDITLRLNQLNETPSEKDHAFRAARTFFKWAVRERMIDQSPMSLMETPKALPSRFRILSEDELKALWTATEGTGTSFLVIVRLLILTGQRRGEIARLEHSWVGETITFPAEVTKNGREHAIPLCPMAKATIESLPKIHGRYVFPAARQARDTTTIFNGWSKPKAQLDEATGVRDWTLHDIRRTFSSNMARMAIPQVVVEKILNHVSGGSLSPIAQIYNRHQYFEEMRDALLNWEKYLLTLS